MNTLQNIYPVSQARSIFGTLVDRTEKNKTILITKKGKIKAAIVDYEYLQQMKKDLENLYKKTYIDKNLLPYTRSFTKKEIEQWLEEDKL